MVVLGIHHRLANCVNQTSITSNYLAMTCNNQLVNTNKTISDINIVTSIGWFVVTTWSEKDSNSSSSPTKVMVTTSQNWRAIVKSSISDSSRFKFI